MSVPTASRRRSRTPAPSSRLSGLVVAVCDGRGRAWPTRDLARWLGRAAPARYRGQVTIALVGDGTSRRLNREYRGVDHATDVLSFPASDGWHDGRWHGPGRVGSADHLGDIVIALGVAARQAAALGHSLATELRVLSLHGLLHLVGYDHERDQGDMRRVETRWRRRGGLTAGLTERQPPR